MSLRTLVTLLLFGFAASGNAAEFPQVSLNNGTIRATVYLPDAEHGYYRGSRFDWSGVIAGLEYAGHSYFGVWFPRYDATLHDSITGPVEEFRTDDSALGYAEAAPGDFFIKIGVGILRKPDNEPYSFARNYQIVNNGKWIVRPGDDRVEFEQDLEGTNGYAYQYSKTVRLARNKPELILEHTLKNTGKRTIETEVYNHDFYVIDGQPTGPDFTVRFPFQVRATGDLKGAAAVRGNELIFKRELRSGHDSASSFLVGYGREAKDNDIQVENRKTGAGVREVGDQPVAKINFWSVRTTLCPEVYSAFRIEPGKKAKWRITYQFYTLAHSGSTVSEAAR